MCEAERVQVEVLTSSCYSSQRKLVIVHLHRHRVAQPDPLFAETAPQRWPSPQSPARIALCISLLAPEVPAEAHNQSIAPAMPLTALTKNEIWDHSVPQGKLSAPPCTWARKRSP